MHRLCKQTDRRAESAESLEEFLAEDDKKLKD
jgi:hypothetical protein